MLSDINDGQASHLGWPDHLSSVSNAFCIGSISYSGVQGLSICNWRYCSANRDGIIKIAKERGAHAIIPGYGFLSENADFAKSVAAAGMVFVGPSPDSIESFGLKHTARQLATKAGVPVVPGTDGLIENEDEAVKESTRLGFPVRYLWYTANFGS